MARPRLMPDNFTLLLVTTVILASVLPCRGLAAQIANVVTNIAIGLLFFLHGAKLSRHALVAGITHWRLHLLVFSFTFIAFPLLGWALQPLLAPLVTPELYLGVLFMCALPATVQSSIAFVSMARGNVSAAVCSASLSSLIGIFLTPVLVRLLLDAHGGSDGQSTLDAIVKICVQLLLPFIAGQLLRPVIGKWVDHHKGKLKFVDQGSILMVVYTAFSAAVIEGLWQQTPVLSLVGLVFICATLLTLVLLATRYSARLLGMSKEDEITVVFCGSKKSLATGVPMAKVLFAGSTMGPVLLPIMLFHQIQLMVCAVLAQRYARRQVVEAAPPVAVPLPK